MFKKDGDNFILSALPEKVVFSDLKNKQACKDYSNCISGTFQHQNNVCSILIAKGKVINNSSAHSWLGYPDTCLIYYKNGTFTAKRLLAVPQNELEQVEWAISGVGLLNMYAPELEGYAKFTKAGNQYDYSDVLRKTNHTVIGVKNGEVYGLYLSGMTAAKVNSYCKTLGLQYAVMLDGGHVAAVNSDIGKANENQKQSNIIQFVIDKKESPVKKKVYIDAGHGGTDPGAVGKNGTQEKDITLQIAKRVQSELERIGVEVLQTRSGDERVVVEERAKLANQAGVDCFVSIHCNSATNKDAGGTETYAYSKTSKGYKLAEAIQKHLVSAVGLADRGVKTAGFVVLNRTSMAAALVETAFISNAREEQLLKDAAWQEKAAQAIAQGICEYLGVNFESKPEYNLKIIDDDGKEVLYQIDQENRNGTVWAPIRQVAEALGCKVGYDGTVIIEK